MLKPFLSHLVVAFFVTVILLPVALANNITITSNTNWNSITSGSGTSGRPGPSDSIYVRSNRTLTVNATNGVCRAIQLGSTFSSTSTGTLTFSASSSQLTLTNIHVGGNSSGTLNMTNGGLLQISGSFTLSNGTFTEGAGTIEYNASGNQTILGETYNNLTLSGGGTKTLDGNTAVNGTFSVQGATAVANGGHTFTYGSSASLTYAGSAPQSTGPEFPSSINTLTINNSSGLTVNSSATINTTLTLTSGKITLGSNTLTIASGGSISGGSSSSYIVTSSTGALRRNAVGATDVIFPVGTSSGYNPVTVNNAGTSDNFSVRVQSTFDNAPPSPSKVVNLQWTITEGTAGGSNATVTLQWNTADEAGSFVRTNPIYVAHYNGSQWLQTAASFADLGGGVYSASASGFTSFSPFGVGNDGALPIQLAAFSASVVRNSDIEVTWKTVSETNNYGFEVYRKRDGTDDWLKIAFVNGHGTTLAPQSYSYLDGPVPFGKYYYRIKQIDLDGKSETFPKGTPSEPEMEVTVGLPPGAFVLTQNYPNPFNPSTQIEFVVPQSGFATLKVYNVLGQEVATLLEGSSEAGKINTVRFDASNLPSGLYYYTLRAAGKVETKRMLLLK
jgi:hypothetical protein